MSDSENPTDESGVHPVIEVESSPGINPETTPFMPEITRQAFRNVGKQLERMRQFFADVFYYKPERTLPEVNLVDKLQQALFTDGIEDEECFVGHLRPMAEGVDDELIISSPRALVLFDCEPQEVTRRHPHPRHAAIKFVDPKEGLYIQPHSGLFTLNFGGLRFHEHGIYEKRHVAQGLNRQEAKAWEEHMKRWKLTPPGNEFELIKKSSFGSILDLLKWKRDARKPPLDIAAPVLVSYPEFQRRLQNIVFTMVAGLNTINAFIDEQSKDSPLPPDDFRRY